MPSAAFHRRPHSSRGTAEIELLLVIPVLLAILLLTAAALRLGTARLANVFSAENTAYQQVTTGQNVNIAANPTPPEAIATSTGQPAALSLPFANHFDESLPTQTVTFPSGLIQLGNVMLSDHAVFLDPTWHYANWPASDDPATLQNWFTNSLANDLTPTITDSLGLQPAWPP